jgi:hypothetical protein
MDRGSKPPATPLRDEDSSYRLGLVPLVPKFLRQFPQPPVQPVLLDVLEPLCVHASGSQQH